MKYQEFINSIKESRENKWFEYSERHHIVPRSIGGTNDPDNLIYLTYEEHFIAHKLLAEENPHNHKLTLAYEYMSKTRGEIVTPEDYARAKELAYEARVELAKDNFRDIWDDPDFVEMKKENSRQTMKKNHQNPEFREGLIIRGRELMQRLNSDLEIRKSSLEALAKYNEINKEKSRAFMIKYNEEHKDDPERKAQQREQGSKVLREYNQRTGSLPIFKKVCIVCNKEFLGKKSQKYCSEECLPARYKSEVLHRICLVCGKEFDTRYKRKRFCSIECRECGVK